MLDGGPSFEIDIDTVNRNISDAEVMTLFFPLLRKTLLVDTRSDDSAGPLVSVVDMVENSSQRFRSLRRMRPRFPRPESITMIPWTLGVGSLRHTGVWELLTARLSSSGDEGCLEAAARCLEELLAIERQEVWRALTGAQHHTLWGRRGVGDSVEDGEA